MDNLTHSLVGALLGQMGMKRKTGLAMPTLIIAANIPDIDAVATLFGGHQHLAIRRGMTHGPIAMLLLPLLLWGAMLWFDAWQTKRGKRPDKRLPVRKGWLLALAYIGCLTHPAFDWLNNYGIRLLEPFSSRWFYGDSIFIIDVWILAILGLGIWISVRRERAGQSDWQLAAKAAFLTMCMYIFANGVITRKAEFEAALAVTKRDGIAPELVVANAQPFMFWKREMLWWTWTDGKSYYGTGRFDLFRSASMVLDTNNIDARELRFEIDNVSTLDPDFRAFQFWSRMPVTRIIPAKSGNGVEVEITDMRFRSPLISDRFKVVSKLSNDQIRVVD